MNLCSESFQAFFRTIARDRFDRVSSDAIGCVAEELHIGRITFSINVPKSDELIEGQNGSIDLFCIFCRNVIKYYHLCVQA